MTITLTALVGAIAANPVLLLIIALCLGATVVNGATDAPNAIATIVGTKAMRPAAAVLMAAAGNFIGLVVITSASTAVASTIFGMLVSRCKALLRRPAMGKLDASDGHVDVQVGPVSLSVRDHLALCGGVELDLTLKEFDLLRNLMENPGQAFSRPQLLEDIWNITFVGETRTVDTHIQTLRRKLNDAHAGAGDLIQTVRGVGYRMSRGHS